MKYLISYPQPRQIWMDDQHKSIIKLDHGHYNWLELFVDLIFGKYLN